MRILVLTLTINAFLAAQSAIACSPNAKKEKAQTEVISSTGISQVVIQKEAPKEKRVLASELEKREVKIEKR